MPAASIDANVMSMGIASGTTSIFIQRRNDANIS